MFPRFALCIGMAAAAIAVAGPQPSWAQNPPPPPAAAPKPEAAPAAPAAPATPAAPSPGATADALDPFGAETTLAAKPIVYVKGTGAWDSAFTTISGALKKVEAYADKAGLKADGPVTIIGPPPMASRSVTCCDPVSMIARNDVLE